MTRLSTLISTIRRRLGALLAVGSLRARSVADRPGAPLAGRRAGAPLAGRRAGAPLAVLRLGAPLAVLRLGAPLARRVLRQFARVRAGYVSIAIVLAVLAAAVYTLPLGAGPASVPPIWRVPQGGPALADGTELPVFCLPETGPAIRCGIAQAHAGGQIGFVPFGAMADTRETMPVLASADIGLLWALADPAARAKVQASAADLAAQMVASVQQVTQSPTWQDDYRSSLRDLLDRATQLAWRAEDTQQAFRALLRASEPVMRDSFANQVGPAMAPYVADAFWRVVRTNSTQVLSLIGGGPLDLSSVGSSFTLALQDPRVQAALGQVGPRIMDLPQSELLTERFVANLTNALQRDPATMALLTRVAMDPRLGVELGHVRNNLAEFMRQLGEVLWGLGGSSKMNALAGLSMKTQIEGASQPLIMMLGPDDAATLARTLPGRATLLVPVTLQ